MHKYIEDHIYNYKAPKIIYDLNVLREKLIFMREASLENNIKILFAVKSFPIKKILEFVSHYVDGFEISNFAEYSLLPKETIPRFISVNDPTINLKAIEKYTADKSKEIIYNLDFLDENITQELQCYRNYPNLKFGLRLSHTALGINASTYRTGTSYSRFGCGLQNTGQIFGTNTSLILGFHIHNGSEVNNVESYIFMANKIIDFVEENKLAIEYINFGGGLANLSENEILILFKEFKNIIPKEWKVFFEPGRLFSKDIGKAIAKIASVKKIDMGIYLVTMDMSYEGSLKWSVPQYYPSEVIYPEKYVAVSFYGASCFEKDLILSCKTEVGHFEQNIIRGNILVFHGIDGYAFAWNHGFNGLPKAEIYFYDSAQTIVTDEQVVI